MDATQDSANPNSDAVLLTFVVGPYRLCASSERVLSIMAPPPLARLPGSDRCQRGVFLHRRRIALVVGLRCKFGLSRRTRNDTGQLILVEIGNELAAFWVDEVLDTPETRHAVWREMPAALRDGVFDRLAVLNQQLYLYVDFKKLLYARSGDVAAAAALRDVPAKPKSINESMAPPDSTPAAASGQPMDISPVAARSPLRAAPARIPAAVRTAPRQRTAGSNPAGRAIPLLGHVHAQDGAQARDWGLYTTSSPAPSPARAADPMEKRNDAGAFAWAWGTLLIAVLLLPLLWSWLSASDRADAMAAGSATKQSALPETTRTGPSSLATLPLPPTAPGTSSARAVPAEILNMEGTDFVLSIERAAKPGGHPLASPPTFAAAPPGTGDWQEVTHIVKRGDTLWAIARRHLGNPFKFAELAKLGRIHNPDLIHPGDRILIRRKPAQPR